MIHALTRSAALPKSITSYRIVNRRALSCGACAQGRTDGDELKQSSGRAWALLGGAISLGLFAYWKSSPVQAKQETKADEPVDGLPVYTAEEVAKHDRKETRVWISFRCGVYDVTEFVDEHPGGDKILLGAGGGIDPFWNIYAVHKTPEILALLETFRIGNLAADDVGAASAGIEDPYLFDPKRHRDLKPASVKPFNAEPPLATLADNYRTPKCANTLPLLHSLYTNDQLLTSTRTLKNNISKVA